MNKLTPKQVRSELARKGWTPKSLARWWGFTLEYTYKIINSDRKRHFDDALRGLPVCPESHKNRTDDNLNSNEG